MPESDVDTLEQVLETSNGILEDDGITRIPDDEYPAVPDLAPTPETPFESSKSSVKASKKDHRAAIGPNTKATKTGPPGSLPDQLIPVPDPKYKIYISDNPNPAQRSKAFYSWWNLLPNEFQNRTIAYVYREWPVLLPVPLGEDGEKTDNSYIDKISGTEPLQDDIDLGDKYGSGDYKIFFNEAGTKFKRTLATIYVRGVRDLIGRPPADSRISNPENVDMNDPQNKGYIAYLRGRGLLPEQSQGREKELEVATITAVQEMSRQQNVLVDKVIEMAQGRDKDRTPIEDALKNSIDVVADGARRSNEMMSEAFSHVKELMQEENKATATERDPMAIALQIMAFMRQGQGDSNGEVAQLRKELAEANNKRMEFLERQLETQRVVVPPTVVPASNSPFNSISEGVKALRSMKEVVEEFSGAPVGSGGGGGGNPVEEAVGDVAPKWLRPFLPLAVAVAQGFFASRGQAAPMPPQSNPNPQPGAGGGIPHYQPPQQIAGPQLVPNPAPVSDAAIPPGFSPELAQLLTAISWPLAQYLHDPEPDAVGFAQWFCAGFGQDLFKQIAGMGADVVLTAITTFPATAAGIATVPRPRVEAFVKEFCAATDKLNDDEDGSEGAAS